jgi:aspartate racemase
MLRETTALIGRMLGKPADGTGAGDGMGGGEKIGVLCTLGARKSGVYDQLLAANGYGALYPPHDEQAALHAAIYDREWGIKAVSPVSQKATDIAAARVERLASAGAACVILGCTELPLALPGMAHKGTLLVDPVLALARALIREVNPAKLKDLET